MSAEDHPANGRKLEPLVSAASPARWRTWLFDLGHAGRSGLAALGFALALGFAAGLLALYLFAALAEDVAEGETEQLDTAALGWLHQFSSPTLDLAARLVSLLGSEALAALLVLLLVVFALKRRWGAAAGLLAVTGGAQLLNDVLKTLFHRTRPAPVAGLIPAQAFSFPSGHAMVAAAFYLFLAYMAWRLLRGRWRALCTAGLVLLVLLIGLARLYLGVHYLSDVAAGYVAGFLWSDAVIIGGHLLAHLGRNDAPARR